MNSNLVPHWATWEHFNELDAKGLAMYGQMTAGSWIGEFSWVLKTPTGLPDWTSRVSSLSRFFSAFTIACAQLGML
jgi:hypothetical protein